MQILIDNTGLNGREVTITPALNSDNFIIEEDGKTYPLTEKQTPGSVVDGELVWQHKQWDEENWRPEKFIHVGLETRQALKPSTTKQQGESLDEAARKYIESCANFGYSLPVYAIQAFKEGATYKWI